MLKGIGASSGIAIGRVCLIKEENLNIKKLNIDNIKVEEDRFIDAVQKAEIQLNKLRENAIKNIGEKEAEIFEAHILMLNDPEFIDSVKNIIKGEKVNSEYALMETVNSFKTIFEMMDNDYMRERASDIGDVGKRILNILLENESLLIETIDKECIIVTKDLTPSDTAQMDKDKVIGFITEIGGRTSHSAIMARTLEIPAVVGVQNAMESMQNGDVVILDGELGNIMVNPDENILIEYRNKQREYKRHKDELLKFINMESKTKDNRKVEIAANIGKIDDAHNAMKYGAEAIGLFRTEFLYMDKESFPTEDEQFNAYKNVGQIMKQKPVIIRTLDIGGDKKLPYLKIDEEMNPFLGYRAIRLCLDRVDIFKTQLKAILRASIYGNLRIMFPMISSLTELKSAKEILEEVKSELKNENIQFNENIQVGIMIEIPSAAIMSDVFAKEVDFFSIGTNDLIQYTVAVDRMNEKISYLYDAYNPAVLRLIKMVIDNAHKHGKMAGMCGEVAGDSKLIPVLLGFGLDEFSMSASSMLRARKVINNLNYNDCVELSNKVLELETASDIKNLLENLK